MPLSQTTAEDRVAERSEIGTIPESVLRQPLPRGGILINAVSKRFRKHTVAKKSYSTIKTSLLGRLFRSRYPRDNFVHALHQLSIYVAPGSSLGLIGSNGSGKSTLLKLIAGIYRPDSGAVKVNGTISALIELGAGFHPDFTGRENLYLGGVMYGLTKREIEQRMDDIIRYAELEDFIDDPVRTYSSGMYMRLGFSLAVHTDPDILLVDEVLAVGDAGFIHRCHDTISDFKRRGKTLIFVTHDLDAVARWCDEAIWLEKGHVRERGEPRWVIDSYLQQVQEAEERKLESANAAQEQRDSDVDPATGTVVEVDESGGKRWGNRDVEITSVRLLDAQGNAKWLFRGDESLTVDVEYQIARPVEDLVFGVGIVRVDGLVVHGSNTAIDEVDAPVPAAEAIAEPLRGRYRYQIESIALLEDSYYLDVAAHRSDGLSYDYHSRRYKFSVRTQTKQHGVYNPRHRWTMEPHYEVAEPLERDSRESGRPAQVGGR